MTTQAGNRMIRRALPLALLMVGGCSNTSPTDGAAHTSDTASVDSGPIVATITCTMANNAPVGPSACFQSSPEDAGGNLKITSGGIAKQYSQMEIMQAAMQANGPSLQFNLTKPFEIQIQANSDETFITQVVIKQGAKTIFQDQTTKLGVIEANSDAL